MFQIDNDTSVLTAPPRPEPGTPGYFTGGIPGDINHQATVVPHWWFNMIQNEIMHVLIGAQIVPDKNLDNQLATAIDQITGGVPSGAAMFTIDQTAPGGWLFLNNDTLGKGSSTATHANDFYRPLYKKLYALGDTYAPVDGGRGIAEDADEDFDANKPIHLLEATGRALIAAGQGTGLTINHVVGSKLGEETHTQTIAELVNHRHEQQTTDGGGGVLGRDSPQGATTHQDFNSGSHTNYEGGGQAFNIIQPSLALNVMIKI